VGRTGKSTRMYEPKTPAKQMVTEKCLIAADVDNTIIAQGDRRDREAFLLTLGPRLIETASLGAHLALLTGNNMDALAGRVLKWLIEQLCHVRSLELLSRFHFFCNSAGVYVHFPKNDPDIMRFCTDNQSYPDSAAVIQVLTKPGLDKKKLAIHPRFIDPIYIRRAAILDDEVEVVRSILQEFGDLYMSRLASRRPSIERDYDLTRVCNGDNLIPATPEVRTVEYGLDSNPQLATVQITLKPILSFRYARNPSRLFGKDMRSKLISAIQEHLDKHGLGHYVARAGGRASIDVTLEKLDKAYGLEFLIDHLNLQGQPHLGQKFGSNTIYFGDEVIVGGGNDYPVTRIPGLLVFAVNSDREFVPYLHHVFIPSTILEGPEATTQILTSFIQCAIRLLKGRPSKMSDGRTALDVLKGEILSKRVADGITELHTKNHLSIEDWQALHAFVSLMSHTDPAAREWLTILTNQLDTIMTQIVNRVNIP
jgi:hypothetical protein